MPRIRELAPYPSVLSPGARNAISDVAGVTVGHFTLSVGEGTADPDWRPVPHRRDRHPAPWR